MSWKRLLFSLTLVATVHATCVMALSADETNSVAPARGGDFTLVAPDGPLSLSDLHGKVVLIFFGYTSCPDVCPISLAKINTCFGEMDEAEVDQVRALFITLDPERDTTEVLRKYTGYFHPNIIGLTEQEVVITAVARQYGVEYQRKPMPGSALGYSISHPTDVLVVDQEGRLVGTLSHDADGKEYLTRIRTLLNP